MSAAEQTVHIFAPLKFFLRLRNKNLFLWLSRLLHKLFRYLPSG